jgi:hypothetical protein
MLNEGELMKRILAALAVMLIFSVHFLPAQNDDDVPYLSDKDIEALESVRPGDEPEKPAQFSPPKETAEAPSEADRLNSREKVYQLIILDRRNCAPNADVDGITETNVLYKFAHLENGYLLILYEVPAQGPVFPVFPKNSYIILDLMANRISTIREYVNSDLFNRFITIEYVLRDLNSAMSNL